MPERLDITEADIRRLAEAPVDRQTFWTSFLTLSGRSVIAEVGVYRGDFAARVLDECDAVERYYMVDPWRHLDDWNKPANKSNDIFERYYQEVLDKTAAHEAKRVLLRGRTLEVADQIGDGELDFVYIDGDHTLRGITTDLQKMYPKVRDGGFIGGDDFCRSMFQHSEEFEPTLVFPYAVYFAEAVGARIYALPHRQFLIHKRAGSGHSFIDLTGRYQDTTIKAQLAGRPAAGKVATPQPPAQAPPEELTARQTLAALARRTLRRRPKLARGRKV